MTIGDLKVNPAEIGGGFGGKTIVYLEPVALTLSKKSGHPVRMNMSREEVFKGTGPTSGASMTVKIGVRRDGAITAAQAVLKYQAGAFPGSPVTNGCMCAFAPYDIPNQRTVGYDVVSNRPKAAAYRAPRRADLGVRGREHPRRGGEDHRHGSARVPAEERRHPGHPDGLRPEARPRRLCGDGAGAARPSRLPGFRSGRTGGAASPRASGSTARVIRPPTSRSTPTAP